MWFTVHLTHAKYFQTSATNTEIEWYIKQTINSIHVLKDLSYSSWEQMENTVIEGKTGLP